METIKVSKDGSKLMEYSGTQFWINPDGKIMQTDNWGIVDELIKAGLANRKFYKNLYGHVDYTLKGNA